MEKNLVPVAIKGLNTKAPEGLRVAGTLDRAQNCYPYKGSTESGLQFRKLSAWAEFSNVGGVGRKITPYRNELLSLFESGALYSWDSSLQLNRIRGVIDPITTESQGVLTNSNTQTIPCVTYNAGYVIYAWEDSRSTNSVRYSVQDYNTGQFISSDVSIAVSATHPRLVNAGTKVLCFWLEGANLRVASLNTASPTVGFTGHTTLKADVHGTPWFDVQSRGSDDVVVAYRVTATGNVVVFNTTSAMTVGTTVNLAVAYDQAGSWLERTAFTDGSLYLAVSSSSTGVKCLKISSAALTLTTTINMDATTAVGGVCGYIEESGQNIWVLFDASSTSLGAARVTLTQSVGGAAGGVIALKNGWYLHSKPIKLSSTSANEWRVLFAYASPSTSTFRQDFYALAYAAVPSGIDTSPGIVARHLGDQGGGRLARRAHVPGIAQIDATTWIAPTLRRVSLDVSGSTFTSQTGVNALKIVRGNSLLGAPVEAGDSVFFPGSLPIEYDSRVSKSVGFLAGPERPTLAAGSGGSLTVSATYQYILVYEEIDINGNLNRSTISDVASVTLSSIQNRVTLTVPYYQLDTTKDGSYGVSIGIYRTEGNGSKFYKIRALSNPVSNSVSFSTTSVIDDLADTTLTSYEPLYTDSGELENFPPPPCKSMFLWNRRLWAIGCEDGQLWPSKYVQKGYGVGWHPGLAIRLPEAGAIIAGIGLEDRALVFAENATFVITGDGPDDTGDANGGRFFVTKLPHEIGAAGPNAVARTPAGAIFMTPSQGIWMHSRGLDSRYIGAPVEGFSEGVTVKSVVVRDDLPQVWFFTAGGLVMIYDWVFDTWCTRTNMACVAACKWSDGLYFLTSDGKIRREVNGTYQDGDGTNVDAVLEFSFLSFAGIEGFKRISSCVVYGEALAASAVTSTAYIDHDDGTSVESWSHTPAIGAREFELEPRYRRCSSWKLTISNPGNNAGFETASLAFWVGVMTGRNRIPAGRRPAQT